jgi:hypothetical protein
MLKGLGPSSIPIGGYGMRRMVTMAAIGAVLGVSGLAAAQTPDYTPHNFSFRVGANFPLDDNLRDLGNALFALGADYRIDRPFWPGGETFFSLDWFGKSTTGSKGNVFPLMVNHKWFGGTGIQAPEEGRRSYFFAGLGAVFIDVGSSDTVLGARGGIGVELGPSFFAEGTLYLSDKSSTNVRATSVAIWLGYRF